MIFDNVENLSLYCGVMPQIKDIVNLLNNKLVDLTPGAHKTDIKGLRYNVASYSTLEGDKEFEIHKREADVQVMIDGSEYITSACRCLCSKAGEYDEAGDASMVQGNKNAEVALKAGSFAIYFPGEPHKPGLAIEKSEKILKVIFKVEI